MEKPIAPSNLLIHLLELKAKFNSKYESKFDESFDACIFSISQLVKEIKILLSDLELITGDIAYEHYNWRLSYGNGALTQDLKKKLFATKCSLKIEDVFHDEVQIQLQKSDFTSEVWSTVGVATIPTIDLCSKNWQSLEFHDKDFDDILVCKMKIQGLFQVEKYCYCKVNHKNRSDGPLHQLVVNVLNCVYSSEASVNEIIPEMLSLMAQIHKKDENQILSCMRLHPGFDHAVCNTYDLFLDTKDSIPKNPAQSGVSAWFLASLFPNVLSILTLFLVVLNDGFDIHMTYDYYNWESMVDTVQNQKMKITLENEPLRNISTDVNCFLSCGTVNCSGISSIAVDSFQDECYPKDCFAYCNSVNQREPLTVKKGIYTSEIDHTYNCELNITSTMDLQIDKQMSVDDFITCRTLHEPACKTMECKIRALNPKLAFVYATTILVFVRIFHLVGTILILWCYKASDRIGISNVISFYLGSCCLGHFMGRRKTRAGKMLSIAHMTTVVIVVGFLMPFATKLFLLITDARIFDLERSSSERYEYRIFKTRCKKCASCSADQCLCIFCGYSTEESIAGYQNQLNLCKMRARRSNTTTRCTVAGFQDTFMCLLQLYLTLPLIKQHYNAANDTSGKCEDINELGEAHEGILAVSLFSIGTSVLCLSRNLTMTYFEISCKGYLARALKARCVYFVYVSIMISVRLLTLVLLGLTYFKGHYYVENGPYTLSCLVVCHVITLFLVGLLQHCTLVKTKETPVNHRKLSLLRVPFLKTICNFQLSFDESLNPEYNQDRQARYRNIQIVLFNLHTSIMSICTLIRTRSFRTLGGIERLVKMSGEVKDKMNFYDRIFFNIILAAEQTVMYYLIYNATQAAEFERCLLYHCITFFIVGKLLKFFFSLQYDPWSLYIPWFRGNAQNCLHKHWKNLICLICCIIISIVIGYLFYFIPQSALIICTIMFTVGPLLFFIIITL